LVNLFSIVVDLFEKQDVQSHEETTCSNIRGEALTNAAQFPAESTDTISLRMRYWPRRLTVRLEELKMGYIKIVFL